MGKGYEYARRRPPGVVIFADGSKGENELVELELKLEDERKGLKRRSVMEAILAAASLIRQLAGMSFEGKEQVLGLMGVLLQSTSKQLNRRYFRDPKLKLMELDRKLFVSKKLQDLPIKLYAGALLLDDGPGIDPEAYSLFDAEECPVSDAEKLAQRQAVAGMVFSWDTGREVRKCISDSGSRNNHTALAACDYYANEPVLFVLGMLLGPDDASLIDLLNKEGRPGN